MSARDPASRIKIGLCVTPFGNFSVPDVGLSVPVSHMSCDSQARDMNGADGKLPLFCSR